jgi:hypothetical protein
MSGIALCLATIALGINVGWKNIEGGGMVYTIQIEPGTLESLRAGEAIESRIPPEVRDVRAYRIVIGKGQLAQELPKNSTETVTSSAPPFTGALGLQTRPPFPAPASKIANSPAPPSTLPPNEASKPLAERSAAYAEPIAGTARSETNSAQPVATESSEPPKPWMLLWAIGLGLCASVTGNIFLAWIFVDARNRCRAMVKPGAGQSLFAASDHLPEAAG